MAVVMDYDVSELIPRFLTDVRENLAGIEERLLALESSPEGPERSDTINTLFRTAHTIKGSSWMMGYQYVGDVAHALEDVLGALRDQRVSADEALIDGLLRTVDHLRRLIDRPPDSSEGVDGMIAGLRVLLPVEASAAPKPDSAPAAAAEASPSPSSAAAPAASTGDAPDPTPPAAAAEASPSPSTAAAPAASSGHVPDPAPPAAAAEVSPPPSSVPVAGPTSAPPVAEDTVRVSVGRLDELSRLTGELMMGGQRAHDFERRSLELANRVRSCLLSIASSPSDAASITEEVAQKVEALRDAARSLVDQVDSWREQQADGTHLLLSATEWLEQEVMALRLLPVSTVFAGLPRLVRDLAREHGKQVQLVTEGESTELDRRILQGLNEALVHLIRNAVDHGLEGPSARQAAGKSTIGTITVRAFRQGGQVRIEVADDGRGMSPQRMRDIAVKKNLITAAEAATLDDRSALDLIYRAGFSSTTLITSTSGRGVGMEAVKTSVNKLGGSVELCTTQGQGTRFTLILPVTLTLSRALLVEANDRTYALPVGGIEGILRLSPQTVQSSAGRQHMILHGGSIPLLSLGSLLAGSTVERDDCPVLVVSASGQRAALAVCRVLDEREVVLKPLGDLLSHSTLAAGVTLLASGDVVPVLDPGACVRAALGRSQATPSTAAPEIGRRRRILVVEDSPTTRELERSILVASGYEVETAVDGAEGLRKVESGEIDLVLTDVEMPRMSGFDLTEALRSDQRFSSLPVIIVTSLAKESEKRRGLEVGAQAYLTKSSFDQSALLDTIERLLP